MALLKLCPCLIASRVVGARDAERRIARGRVVLQGRVEIVVAVDALEHDRPLGALQDGLDAGGLPIALQRLGQRGVLRAARCRTTAAA